MLCHYINTVWTRCKVLLFCYYYSFSLIGFLRECTRTVCSLVCWVSQNRGICSDVLELTVKENKAYSFHTLFFCFSCSSLFPIPSSVRHCWATKLHTTSRMLWYFWFINLSNSDRQRFTRQWPVHTMKQLVCLS